MSALRPVHVVGFNGSPHRDGNTVALMRWVLEGCEEVGANVEWLHLVDYDVRYCQGCFTCLRTGACPTQDDFVAVRDHLLAADGIVVGSPVYEGQPTAQLKTFMDRATMLNLYTRTFERQRTVGVATSGVAPVGRLAGELANFFGRHSGAIGAKTASVRHGYRPLAEFHNPRLPERARAVGRRLVADVHSPRRSGLLGLEYAWFAILQRFIIHPLVTRHPDQFAGVVRIWEEKGWL